MIIVLILKARNITGDWVDVLFLVLTAFALIGVSVYTARDIIKKFPKHKDATIEWHVARIVQFLVVLLLGYAAGKLFSGPIAYEKEFAQGVLTASSVLMALTGVLLGIFRLPTAKKPLEDLVVSRFRLNLILSLFSGLASIFLILAWYAKANFSFLQWAFYPFCLQLCFVLAFLFFPKYYLK